MSDERKIKAFASDDNLKKLGQLLNNDTARKIMSHLMNNEMYTNEIATKLDLRVSLVIHHLKKMEDLGLVEITEKIIKRKGSKHRFFKINSDLFITLNNTKTEVKEKGILEKIFRDGIKFSVIGVAALFSSLIKLPSTPTIKYPGAHDVKLATDFDFLLLPLIIIISGLVIERVWFGLKKRKGVN